MEETFRREDFLFDLPEDRIAQTPAAKRDQSRLLVAEGSEQPLQHTIFSQLSQWLRAGDVVVLNQTKVMNARCFAVKDNGVRIEVFVLSLHGDPKGISVLFRPAKRVKPGMALHFPNANVWVEVMEKGDQGRGVLNFKDFETLLRVLELDGTLPLPPYIKRQEGPSESDEQRYQTVFANQLGAVAAPTAGLHFSKALLEQLNNMGVQMVPITHHVGIGTFKPLIVDDIRQHEMDGEYYEIEPESAEKLNQAKADGRRIIAVGTTSTRCLESNFDQGFHAGKSRTELYIYPGYQFKAINGLITNFHLPGSTLILLVAALMGRDRIVSIYKQAIEKDYRFYSFGDAMLLLP